MRRLRAYGKSCEMGQFSVILEKINYKQQPGGIADWKKTMTLTMTIRSTNTFNSILISINYEYKLCIFKGDSKNDIAVDYLLIDLLQLALNQLSRSMIEITSLHCFRNI